LFVHIGQWIIFRKYVPPIVTSILALPYCGYTLIQFLQVTDLSAAQMVFWAGLGVALTVVSFSLRSIWRAASRIGRIKNTCRQKNR
jgi:hypothetical protein